MPLKLSPTQVAFEADDDGTFNKPFDEQVKFFQGKLNLPTERYDDALKNAHDRAFVVSGAMKADLLEDFRTAIDRAITEGKSIEWFRANFDEIVRRHGWEGWTGSGTQAGRDWRTRTIYSTNLSTSYAAGRWQQLHDPELLERRPFWKYIHNDTVQNPRPLHVSWSGIVLRADDPWWTTRFPPGGWGCRCRVTAVRPKEYKRERPPDNGTYTKKDKFGVTHTIPNGIDFGWDYAPGSKTDTSLRELVQQKLIGYPDAISKALSADIRQEIVSNKDPAAFAKRVIGKATDEKSLWMGFVENPDDIKKKVNIDVQDYLVILPAETPGRVDRSPSNKKSTGQRPVKPADYNLIPEILREYDSIIKGKRNNEVVVWKQIGKEWFRAGFQIVSGSNRRLDLKSFEVKTEKPDEVK